MLTELGIGLGASIINKIVGGKQIGPGMKDPSQFREDIVMGEGDLAMARQSAGRQTAKAGATALNRIRTLSAGGRLPKGTAAGQIKSLARSQAEGLGQAEVGFQEAKRESELDFYNEMQRYEAAKEGAVRAAQPLNLTEEIGMLTKGAMFLNAGLFDEMEDQPVGRTVSSSSTVPTGGGQTGVGVRSTLGGGALQPANMGVGGSVLNRVGQGSYAPASPQYRR